MHPHTIVIYVESTPSTSTSSACSHSSLLNISRLRFRASFPSTFLPSSSVIAGHFIPVLRLLRTLILPSPLRILKIPIDPLPPRHLFLTCRSFHFCSLPPPSTYGVFYRTARSSLGSSNNYHPSRSPRHGRRWLPLIYSSVSQVTRAPVVSEVLHTCPHIGFFFLFFFF